MPFLQHMNIMTYTCRWMCLWVWKEFLFSGSRLGSVWWGNKYTSDDRNNWYVRDELEHSILDDRLQTFYHLLFIVFWPCNSKSLKIMLSAEWMDGCTSVTIMKNLILRVFSIVIFTITGDISYLNTSNKFGCDIPCNTGLIICLHPTNERWHYFVMTSLIGWAQA